MQEVFIKQYTKSFYDKLKGSKKEHGLFAKQCIVQPAKEYSKQITEWSNGYKQSIASTLNKDNAILSELDEKIKMLESRIKDMERRLKNLSSVRQILQHVLPENSEVR